MNHVLIFPFASVIESHPDNALEDLRLDQPFADFSDHIQSYDLDSMEKKVCALSVFICQVKPCCLFTIDNPHVNSSLNLQDHSHTPWIIVVAKYLQKWLNEVIS